MRIAILGTRGIPNRYGGFEQCAEYLAVGLAQRGHEVTVYSSSTHEYREDSWRGVRIVHCYDPEKNIGTAGQFIYDLACILHARRQRPDVALHLGYTSSSVWWRLWPGGPTKNLVNMDGLEWARSKYSPRVQQFLKRAERWAALHADALIADSPGIQAHLQYTFGKASTYIPYGAEPYQQDPAKPLPLGLAPQSYYLLIARMEPENNIEMILRGYADSSAESPMIVIGNAGNAFGKKMQEQFAGHPQIRFAGPIYDAAALNALRHDCRLYFHGHSVGGTNPSLLEAMAAGALIAAHANRFNGAVCEDGALYFSNAVEVESILQNPPGNDARVAMIAANLERIRTCFSWPLIVDAYEAAMVAAMDRG